jgi:dihydrodipicolinate synthase/N-acetylneuraminate lyase
MIPPTDRLPDGVGVALVTIFGLGDKLELGATTERAIACVEAGMTAVLVGDTTGEPWRLSVDDRIELAASVNASIVDVSLIVGAGNPDADSALAMSKAVGTAGVADALLVLCPNSSLPLPFYSAVREALPSTPLFAYHIPELACPGIGTDDVDLLPVDAMKDFSGNADRLAALTPRKVPIYVGSANLLLTAGAVGARGALVALANKEPERCAAAWSGDAGAQRYLSALHVATMTNFPSALK